MTSSTVEPLGDFVLTLSCADRPGIVHAVTSFLMDNGGNIRESQQFGDREHGRFFMRIDFETAQPTDAATLRASFAATAEEFGMTYFIFSGSPETIELFATEVMPEFAS